MRRKSRSICRLTIIFGLITFFGAGNAWSQDLIVIGFGDSITAGWPFITYYPNGARVGGYEPKLEALLAGCGTPAQVLNYGLPGEQTSGGVGRIDGVLAASSPNFCLILESTNDIFAGVSPQTTVANMGIMVDKALAAGCTPIMSTLTPHTQIDVAAGYNAAIFATAAQKGVAVADLFSAVSGNWGALSDDGIHPNDAGYQALAQAYFAAISAAGGCGGSGGGGDDGGSSGPCFIATAAYGSPIAPEIDLLRAFRDTFLITNRIGAAFVNTYYRYSPPLANFISTHESLRKTVRWCLYPLVGISWMALKVGMFTAMALMSIFFAAIGFGMVIITQKMRKYGRFTVSRT